MFYASIMLLNNAYFLLCLSLGLNSVYNMLLLKVKRQELWKQFFPRTFIQDKFLALTGEKWSKKCTTLSKMSAWLSSMRCSLNVEGNLNRNIDVFDSTMNTTIGCFLCDLMVEHSNMLYSVLAMR